MSSQERMLIAHLARRAGFGATPDELDRYVSMGYEATVEELLNSTDSQHSSPTTPRPFKVLGVQQIAIGGLDKAALRRFWIDILGLRYASTYRNEKENVDEDICEAGAGVFKVEVDLMQPVDPEQRPKVHDPSLNHIGLWIDDLPVAVEWLEAQGVRFTPGGIRKGATGFDVCFIHPKGNDAAPIGAEGVLLELVQAPAEVREAFETLERASG